MKKILLIILLIIFFHTYANAYTALNAAPCGEIIEKQDSKSAKLQIRYYVTGYISGYNRLGNTSFGKNMQTSEYDSLYWAIVKFCKENPLKDLEDASFYVLSQLRNK